MSDNIDDFIAADKAAASNDPVPGARSQLPTFNNPALRIAAFTHRSYAHEHPEAGEDNERLEFLGDAVLGFIVGRMLYQRYPHLREGQLTRLRSQLVNNERQLAEFALALGVDRHLLLGKGAERDGSRRNPDLLSDALEAIIGAYCLDAGIDAVRAFLEPLFAPVADRYVAAAHLDTNTKGRLQEWALAAIGELPRYAIVGESGQDHGKEFTAEVWVGDRSYGRGKGPSKKAAEKAAARAALDRARGGESETEPPN